MAEYINKADAMKVACGFMRFTGIDEAPYEYADNLLNNLPTIEIPEEPHFKTEAEGIAYLVGAFTVGLDIVHCKECKYFCTDDGLYCSELLRETRADWFCADGERK